jgi:hypothetical protein
MAVIEAASIAAGAAARCTAGDERNGRDLSARPFRFGSQRGELVGLGYPVVTKATVT